MLPALILAISVPAAAQNQVPTAFRSLRPHQIVEAVAAERETLHLTPAQERRLDSLHLAIRGERHRYVVSTTFKGYPSYRMAPMISRTRAYAGALGILTPEQRSRAMLLFTEAGYGIPERLRNNRAVREGRPEPLGHHVAGAGPARQSTQAFDVNKDPLSHKN